MGVATYARDDDDRPATGKVSDLAEGKVLIDNEVVDYARANLFAVADFALIGVEGHEDAEGTMFQEITTSPVAAAWHARSMGYTEGVRDSAEKISRLQSEVSRLRRADNAGQLLRIAQETEARIESLTEVVTELTHLVKMRITPA